MSIVLSTYITFNDTTTTSATATHLLRTDWASSDHHLAFGNMGLHYDQIFITNLSSDPLRITFDDFNDTKIDAGDGFVIAGSAGTVGPIQIHAQYNIKVVRHTGSGTMNYSIMATVDNKLN